MSDLALTGSVIQKRLKLEYVNITKHGLKIPVDATDYAGFVTKMKTHEQEFKKEFFAQNF